MAGLLLKVCRSCELRRRCDIDVVLRSYATSADENGCTWFKAIKDMDELQNQWAREAAEKSTLPEEEYDEEARMKEITQRNNKEMFDSVVTEYIESMTAEYQGLIIYLSKWEDNFGFSLEPKQGISPEQYIDYLRRINRMINALKKNPPKSDVTEQYIKLCERYEQPIPEDTDPYFPHKMTLKTLHTSREHYINYGLTGEGSKDEKIRKEAELAQQRLQKEEEERIANEKLEEERRAALEEEKMKAQRNAKEEKQERTKQQQIKEEKLQKEKDEKFWYYMVVAFVGILLSLWLIDVSGWLTIIFVILLAVLSIVFRKVITRWCKTAWEKIKQLKDKLPE